MASLQPPTGSGTLLHPSGKNPYTFIRPHDKSPQVYCLLENCHDVRFGESVQYELKFRANGKRFSRKVVPVTGLFAPPHLVPEPNIQGLQNVCSHTSRSREKSANRNNGGGRRSRSRGRNKPGGNPGANLPSNVRRTFTKVEDIWVEVIVKKVLPETLFASAKETLPPGYNSDSLVLIKKAPLGKISSLLEFRDVLKVVLGTKDKTKPFAIKSAIVKCQPFNPSRLGDFLAMCKPVVQRNQEQNFESTEAILSLIRPIAIWEGALASKAISFDVFKLIVKILAELAKKLQGKEAKKFFEKITLTSMFHPIKGRCIEFAEDLRYTSSSAVQDLKDFFQNGIMRHCPKNCARLLHLLEVVSEFQDNFWIKTLKTCLRHINQDNDVAMLEWNELPKTPTITELGASNEELDWSLNPVPLKVGFESNDHYFDTFVRLLREDCFFEMKQGIQKLLSKTLDVRDMKVHKGVRIMGYLFSDSGLNILLSVKRTKSSPKVPKRSELQSGNLLCISPLGTFRDPIWATCMLRDKQYSDNQDELRFMVEPCVSDNKLNLQEILQSLFLRSGKLIVAESPTYYRAHEPVLTVLQNRNCEEFPFTEEIINLSKDCDSTPEYLLDFDLDELPPTDVQYDESQEEAVKHVFENRVSMIQGPPGCGKTFIGVQIVKTLIDHIPIPDSPILVLTYKNHALDEFLLRIGALIGMNNVCRVGGRCMEPRLDSVTLRSIKSEKRSGKSVDLQETWREICALKSEIEDAAVEFDKNLKALHKLSFFEAVDFVTEYLTDEQIKCLLLNTDDIPLTGNAKFKTITAKKKLTKDTLKMSVKDIQQTIENLGMQDFKEALTSEVADDNLADLRTIVRYVVNAWAPSEEFVTSVETEFCVSQSILSAELAEKPADDVTDDDKDDDEFEERLNYISSFRDIDETLGRLSSFAINKVKNNPALSLLPFAEKLCENSPDTILESTDNLWTLSSRCRLIVIQKKLMDRFSGCKKICEEQQEEYASLCQQKNELEERYSAAAVFDRKVIAMTITGASIHSNMLACLTPKIVIVEEAAEVLEPQLMAVLGPQVQHLIMIGDHKQLPPSVQCHKLAVDYNFNTSMMQRLIEGNMPYATLRYQNRMRPTISKYLKDIYPNLKDGERVKSIKRVELFKSDIFFWDHQSHEIKERSVSNREEAERAVRLAMFLISQKFDPANITIISAYSGQTTLVRKRLEEIQKTEASKKILPANLTRENNVKMHTIDMYQGDENEIVIVSMVRSNEEKQLGFVKLLNRRCVAQSRAKRAIIFIGNLQTLYEGRHWKQFLNSLSDEGFLGKSLPIMCPKHPLNKISIKDSSDFPSENYCTATCDTIMRCKAHKCQRPCMPSHDHSKCTARVKYQIPSKCLHIRSRKCFEDSLDIICLEPCPKLLLCGHQCPKTCEPRHDHPTQPEEQVHSILKRYFVGSPKAPPTVTIFCSVKVKHTCKVCKKEGEKACSEPDTDFKCLGVCVRKLECKHPCTRKCHEACPAMKDCELCIKLQKKMDEEYRQRKIAETKKLLKKFEEKLSKVKASSSSANIFERFDLKKDSAEHFHVSDLVLKFIQPVHNWNPRIVRIEKIDNLELKVRYYRAMEKMFDPSYEGEKFHGTIKEAVEGIIKEGFRLPKSNGRNMYGDGVYLASDSSKSAQDKYTKDSNMLLLCKVALGKCKTVSQPQNGMTGETLKNQGFDSLFAKRDSKSTGGVLYDEFVVFDPDRVLPTYVIHYQKDGIPKIIVPSTSLGSTGYKRIELENKREGSDPLGIHYKIAAYAFHGLLHRPEYQGPRKIKKIFYHLNDVLESKFKTEEQHMKMRYKGNPESDFVLAFHGTPNPENIDKIVRENFRMDKIKRTAHGHGIYFSEFPEVSLAYAGSNLKLLLCQILPGKSHEGDCKSSMCSCDSHRIGKEADGRGQMIVMFNTDRILPCYELRLH